MTRKVTRTNITAPRVTNYTQVKTEVTTKDRCGKEERSAIAKNSEPNELEKMSIWTVISESRLADNGNVLGTRLALSITYVSTPQEKASTRTVV